MFMKTDETWYSFVSMYDDNNLTIGTKKFLNVLSRKFQSTVFILQFSGIR